MKKLKGKYEFWNIDNLNEEQLAKTNFSEIKFINDNIGNFNKELPDNYFDFVYSISHFKFDEFNNKEKYDKILKDINRVLKFGGYSLHCVISMLKDPAVFLPQLFNFIFDKENTINEFVAMMKTSIDPDLYFLSEKYYDDNWQSFTGKSFRKFGKPISYNILWEKTS
jgi:ubiquinone/menaquinone biosynthesis C-methylase UbiE